MDVRSLAWRTDLVFNRFEGEVLDRGDHLVVRTPSNPAFHWGNYLLFDGPPGPGDHDRWLGLYREAFASTPGVRHVALGWDGTDGAVGEVAPFEADGFEVDPAVALTATEVHPPPRPCAGLEVRPLSTDAEWAASLDNQVQSAGEGFEPVAFRAFRVQKQASYRRMEAAGLGHCFGAFLDGELVADLGLFVEGGLGRFQSVATRAAFRRRGIAGTLVFEAARHALTRMGARELVIVADADRPPARVYASVGFREVERSVGMCRPPPAEPVGV